MEWHYLPLDADGYRRALAELAADEVSAPALTMPQGEPAFPELVDA